MSLLVTDTNASQVAERWVQSNLSVRSIEMGEMKAFDLTVTT
jgi:hypothetical protein